MRLERGATRLHVPNQAPIERLAPGPAADASDGEKTGRHLYDLLESLHAKYKELQDEIQRIYRLYVDGKIDGDAFGQFFAPLEERQAEVDLLKVNHLSMDQILTEAKDLHAHWPSLTREEKQRIAESITEKIVVGKDEIDITLCRLPSSEEITKEQRKLTPAAATPAAPPAASSSSKANPSR